MKSEKIYWNAPEIARILNETDTTIRFWAKQFEVYRKGGSHDYKYPRESVAKFHIIQTLLRIDKYTIAGAKQKLNGH